nr:DUF2238 domain-containing protein [Clostridium guangxiense]
MHIILLIIFILSSVISAIKPTDYSAWFFEYTPAFIGVMILIFTYKKFRFTDFVYVLILILTITIIIGAHYKYSHMPLFNYIRDVYHLKRNDYDRYGHFMQGFVPAFIIREILIRKLKLKKGIILSILVICICLAVSGFYEILEGVSCLIYGRLPEDFLEYQGDKLDTQWDMLSALIGSIFAVTAFYKVHDRSIKRLTKHKNISSS